MNDVISIDLDYKEDEVIAAQHMRFMKSSRLIVIGITVLLGTLYLAIQQYNLWKLSGEIPSTWYTSIYLPIIFLGVGFLIYFLAPSVDYRQNSFWKYTYQLKLLPERLYLSIKNKDAGIKYDWKDASKVLEGKDVFIVYYGSESHFLIIPKRILGQKSHIFGKDWSKQSSSPPTQKV